MCGEACEAGASATIVSSDKDLMQLVNDCVTMYDTMKDRRIGPAEVIEKFGVPPDKVIEVQALIGDSTDNVPACPASGSRPRPSSSPSSAISRHSWGAPTRSSRRSAASR